MSSVMVASSDPQGQPQVPGVLQLERFLDMVLKTTLQRLLAQRDATRTAASQCTQLIALFDDMQAVSHKHSFIAVASANDRASETRQAHSARQTPGADVGTATSSVSATTAAVRRSGVVAPPRSSKILVDIGNHFYTQGYIANAEVIHVNIGCGVVLPMSLDEARAFLVKKERVLRERAGFFTREVLRTKYRIRLVTEAIARLHDRDVLQGGVAQ